MRVLLSVEAGVAGHAVRSGRLLRYLAALDWQIDVVASGRFSRLFEPLLLADSTHISTSLTAGGIRGRAQSNDPLWHRRSAEFAWRAQLDRDLYWMKHGGYDLCIADGSMGTRIAALLTGVPLIYLASLPWAYTDPSVSDPTLALLRRESRLAEAITFKIARHRVGWEPLEDEAAALHDPFDIARDLPESRIRSVGGLLPVGRTDTGQRRSTGRLATENVGWNVLATFGSTGFVRDDELALLDTGDMTLAQTPDLIISDDLLTRGLSDWIESSDIVLCHGGAGTLSEAISSSRPVLSIPRNAEQHALTDILENRGLGSRFDVRQSLSRVDLVTHAASQPNTPEVGGESLQVAQVMSELADAAIGLREHSET